VLYLTEDADVDEVSSFMRVSGASEILCDGRFSPDFFGIKPSQGVILSKEEAFSDINRDIRIVQPGIRDAYYLIVRCTGKNFQPPKFEDFYVDVNHKLRHNTMRIFGAKSGNKLVSVAMTVAESMYGAVLGAVACDPDFRKQGYASGVVKYLTNSLVAEGKTVYLHRAQNQNERFYSQLGFTEFGTWKEYKLIR
jgi:predicted GNAT family acetyltransferase